MGVFDGQFGFGEESTWGTEVTVSRFLPTDGVPEVSVVSEQVSPVGRRAGQLYADAAATYNLVKASKIKASKIEVPTKGFGLLLKHALGSVAAGTAANGHTPFTFAPGALVGRSLTVQTVEPFNTVGGGGAFTVAGAKVDQLKLSIDTKGVLECDIDMVGKAPTTATAIATAAYAASSGLFPWTLATFSLGGAGVCIDKFALTHKNGLKSDRYAMCAGRMDEPAQNKAPTTTISLEGIAFNDLAHYERFVATSAAGAQVSLTASFKSPASPYAELAITIPAAIVSDWSLDGDRLRTQKLGLEVLDSGTGSPFSIVYTTSDVTV